LKRGICIKCFIKEIKSNNKNDKKNKNIQSIYENINKKVSELKHLSNLWKKPTGSISVVASENI
jgi:hypothetical protein